MENTIIYLTIYAAIVTGLVLVAILIIILQRRQLWRHEDRIRELTRKQDIFPDPAGSIHLVQTRNFSENENNFKLDNNYMRG